MAGNLNGPEAGGVEVSVSVAESLGIIAASPVDPDTLASLNAERQDFGDVAVRIEFTASINPALRGVAILLTDTGPWHSEKRRELEEYELHLQGPSFRAEKSAAAAINRDRLIFGGQILAEIILQERAEAEKARALAMSEGPAPTIIRDIHPHLPPSVMKPGQYDTNGKRNPHFVPAPIGVIIPVNDKPL